MEQILDQILTIANFIVDPTFTGWLLVLKIVCILLSICAIIFIISVAVFKTDWLNWWLIWDIKEFLTYRPYGLPKVTKKWEKIKKKLEENSEVKYKEAILEADDLLNKCLQDLRLGLETLEETLKKRIGSYTLPNIEEVKKAHTVRNRIVQELDFKISLDETKSLLEIYEKALKYLGML